MLRSYGLRAIRGNSMVRSRFTRLIPILLVALLVVMILYSASFNYVYSETIYSEEYTIPPRSAIIITVQLNPRDEIKGTIGSLSTCTIEFCIDVAGIVFDPNNNVVEIFRINYTKPSTTFFFKTYNGGVFRIVMINLLIYEAYVRLTLERTSGVVSTPPKVLIPTTTVYTTITTTTTLSSTTTETLLNTITVEKSIAILIPTTITSTYTITYTTTTTNSYTVMSTSIVEKTLTLRQTIVQTFIESKTYTQTQVIEVEKTVLIPTTIETTVTLTPTQSTLYALIGFIIALILVIIVSAIYVLLKFIRRS